MISIVITTFNRAKLVQTAIENAEQFLLGISESEIIVVDDCSVDDTANFLRNKYQSLIESGTLRIISHTDNRGVTASKNTGAKASKNEWIIFLDSDDTLIVYQAEPVLTTLTKVSLTTPAVFFRCQTVDGQLIGREVSEPFFPGLVQFMKTGVYGEFLPAVRRAAFLASPYPEDLRGFEGLTYLSIIKEEGPVMISPIVARVYDTSNGDRLSAKQILMRRGCLIARGYMRMLRLYAVDFPININLKLVARIAFHMSRCIIARILWKS